MACMSVLDSKLAAPRRRAALSVLLIIHAAAGIYLGAVSPATPAILMAFFLAVVFCQASLVGLWSGLSAQHGMLRLVGLIAGAAFLAIECNLGIGQLSLEIAFFAALPCVLVAGMTWVARRYKGKLSRLDSGQSEKTEALQFSIRHLLLLTFAVACLVAVGKTLAPVTRGLDILAQITVLGVGYTVVALTSIWAVLGTGRPMLRSPFVVLMAAVAGAVSGYTADAGRDLWFWASVNGLQTIFLVATLWVVRAAGYRFVAK